jgi:UDP-N-acetylmuramoyl-tripeptide--D-alanyl-D-alanine ligase
MTPLWTAGEAAAATGAASRAEWRASGVSIDSRSLAPGDLFVALAGPNHDGHDFVAAAFQRGAAAAMVHRDIAGLSPEAPLLVVDDTLAALGRLAAAARRRSHARIAAVTGSVGKTGTKEALRLALAACGTTAASASSLNNHWGVPLSLARLPREGQFGVFEIGMNHPGEIAPLSCLVRPHVAIVTTVEPAHLGFFASLEAIADAKAEIFLGLEPGGVAVLNRDNAQFPRLAAAAKAAGATVLGFGAHPEATARLIQVALQPRGSQFTVALGGDQLRCRLEVAGRHWVQNALAVLAAAAALGADPRRAAAALSDLRAPPGRGRRHELPWRGGRLVLLDDSYNASPAAVRAALSVLAGEPPASGGRRVAVLGDMLELGEAAERLHRELREPLFAAGVDRVFLVGEAVEALDAVLPAALRGGVFAGVDACLEPLLSDLRPGDVVLVKGSHAGRLDRVVESLIAAARGGEVSRRACFEMRPAGAP